MGAPAVRFFQLAPFNRATVRYLRPLSVAIVLLARERVALSGGVLPAFLPAAGLPCPPSSFLGPVIAPERTERRSIWQNGRARRPVLSIGPLQPCNRALSSAAFRGDRASCERLHAF